MKKFLTVFISLLMASATLAASDKEEAKVADQAEAKAFDRGVGKMNSVFIPKGYIGGGFTFSYKTYDLGKSADDVGYSMLFSLLSGINGDMHTLGISPSVSYFLLDNFSVGARFDYSRTNLNVGNLGLSLGDLASLSIQDYHMLKNMYSTAVTARYYMPIANSKRIAMFGEVRLGFDVGQSVSYQTKDGNNFGTFQSIYGGGLNVVPGLCVFATNEVCVEVAVGVLGINYQYVKQVTNLVDESAMQQSGANFKINPLSISLGMSFYIPVSVPGRSSAGKSAASRAPKQKVVLNAAPATESVVVPAEEQKAEPAKTKKLFNFGQKSKDGKDVPDKNPKVKGAKKPDDPRSELDDVAEVSPEEPKVSTKEEKSEEKESEVNEIKEDPEQEEV
ncbi:MAG: hypothetical protein IJ495_07825 [Bacteroidales bacterium]|nr:hypothetical protein [Bacteroidales bacterium]